MRAEQAELGKERALKAKKEERKFKYLLGIGLLILGIYTFLLYHQYQALSASEEQLAKRNEFLEKNYGLTENQLDSVNKVLEQLPTQRKIELTNTLMLKKIKSDLEDLIRKDSIQVNHQIEIQNGKLIVLAHLFPRNATLIPDTCINFLTSIVKVANNFPAYGIHVEAHTDDSGEANQNLKTSFYRASQIGILLVDSLGFDALRLHISGKGESNPLIPIEGNMSFEKKSGIRDKNRRINLIFSLHL